MSEKTLPWSTENINTYSPLINGQRSLTILLVKYNWYKDHDESNERLKAHSRLLLQPALTQRWAKKGRMKSSSGNMQGRGDCFIPPSWTRDSVFHDSLHLKKWAAAWQREQQWALKPVQNHFCTNNLAVPVDLQALQPWDTASFCQQAKSSATFGGGGVGRGRNWAPPQILLLLLWPLGGPPEQLI